MSSSGAEQHEPRSVPPAPFRSELHVVANPLQRIDIAQVREILPQLIDSLTDGVLVLDRERRVVAANRRYMEAFGAHIPRVIGETCHDALACPEAAAGNQGSCAACDAMQSGEPRRLVRAFQDADGIVRRWEGTLNPVRDADGGIRHVVEVWRDISERTQLEGQLAHSERLASLGMLAAGVAHEINNPLASIVLGVESLSRWVARVRSGSREGLDEPAEVIELLSREANRTREITDKLMLLAQPYQTTAGWVDLNRAAHDTLTLLNHQMRKQGIEAVESLAPDIPAVWARESGLRGVLMNLCINAVQAMPAGGSLTVRSWMLDGTRIAFEIADTGTGINPAHLERIWDPFFTTKPVGSGTGLGLSITRRVVERHGGSIRVTSEPGKGARFVIVLPVHGPGGDRA